MRKIIITALASILAMAAVPILASTAHYVTTTQVIDVTADRMQYYSPQSVTQNTRIVITGSVNIKSVDKTSKALMEATGSKVVLEFAPVKTKNSGAQYDSLTTADISGPVTMVYTTNQPTGTSKVTATAGKAVYTDSDQIARLSGGVKVVQDDPTYAEPAVVTGETAMVDLDANPAPDDIAVEVSTPGGISRIEAAPNAAASVLINASRITTRRNGSVVLQDNAYIKNIDKTTNAVMEAKGSKMVMQFAAAGPETSGLQLNSLQNAEISGPVTIINTTTQPMGVNKVTATADRAVYSGNDQIARLTGGVNVVQELPIYTEPATMRGETAMVNLNPNPGPNDITFEVDTPGGVSRIEVTPKPKEGK